jgi:hypothetical protein
MKANNFPQPGAPRAQNRLAGCGDIVHRKSDMAKTNAIGRWCWN